MGGRLVVDKLEYWTREWPNRDANMLSHTDNKMSKKKDGSLPPPRDRTPCADLSRGYWTRPRWNGVSLVDYYVRDLAVRVQQERFPQGLDKGELMLAVEYVLGHPLDIQCQKLKLGGVANFIQVMGFG
jgi:hypothetical protein